jgi:uncharacterized protein (TIRG00374 family)
MMEPSGKQAARKIASLILRGLLAVALLIVLFQYVSISEVVNSILKARFDYLAGAFILMTANIAAQMLKWRYFVRLMNPEISNTETVASFLFGMTLGTVTPGQIGEFGGRVLGHGSLPAGRIIGLTLVDRLQMICVLGLAGIISFTVLFHFEGLLTVSVVLPFGVFFVYLFFNPSIIARLLSRLNLKIINRPLVQDFIEAIEVFQSRQLFISLLYSITFYLIVYFQMCLLLNSFSQVGPTDAFWGFAAMMFLKALVPISLGDLGIREASSVYFYSLRGIAGTTSLSASLLLFVINVLVPSILGLIFTPDRKSVV